MGGSLKHPATQLGWPGKKTNSLAERSKRGGGQAASGKTCGPIVVWGQRSKSSKVRMGKITEEGEETTITAKATATAANSKVTETRGGSEQGPASGASQRIGSPLICCCEPEGKTHRPPAHQSSELSCDGRAGHLPQVRF